MPTIKRFGSTRIVMYGGDHNPPHVHVIGTSFEAQVAIGSGEILNGTVPARVRQTVLRWIAQNDAMLTEIWRRLTIQG